MNSDPCAGGQPKSFFLQIPTLPSGELLGNSPGSSINLTPFSSPTACSESIKNHHCVKLCVLILEWFSHTAASYLCDEPSAWGWNYKSGFSFDNGETDAGEKNLLQFLFFFIETITITYRCSWLYMMNLITPGNNPDIFHWHQKTPERRLCGFWKKITLKTCWILNTTCPSWVFLGMSSERVLGNGSE